MGRVYWLNKINFVDVPIEVSNIEFVVARTISKEDYRVLRDLMAIAKGEISEDITDWGEQSFVENSSIKDEIFFNVCLAKHLNKIVGFGIAFHPMDEIGVYNLDLIFVQTLHRGKNISNEIARHLIKSDCKPS